jgi:isoleucyl-tRNA synthetase
LYCDRPDSHRRRAARTVLDHLHRCLTTWLAPVLVFTADEAWTARFGEDTSVHLQDFPDVPERWRDDALAAKFARVRELRGAVTTVIETERQNGRVKSSLQAAITLHLADEDRVLLKPEEWAEIAIVSSAAIAPASSTGQIASFTPAPGEKCARCWKVLAEVGHQSGHPALCRRCADAVDSGLVCQGEAA